MAATLDFFKRAQIERRPLRHVYQGWKMFESDHY